MRQVSTAPVHEQLHELLLGKDRRSALLLIGPAILDIFAQLFHHVAKTRVKLLPQIIIVILWHALSHLPDVVEANSNRFKFCRVQMLFQIRNALIHLLDRLPRIRVVQRHILNDFRARIHRCLKRHLFLFGFFYHLVDVGGTSR
jgi:hypothetical protein